MSAFSEHCGAIVKEYVHTVLIIDDRAGLGHQNITETVEQLDDLLVNDPFIDHSAVANAEEVIEPVEEVAESAEELIQLVGETIAASTSHELNALELTNAFYQKGIIAGLYQPLIAEGEGANDFANKAEGAAATADIIILDWMLKGSDSSYSQAIVKKIIDLDNKSGGRIRNIIIYTGEPNLNSLKDELYTTLDDNEIDKSIDFELSSKNLKISFYNKPNPSARSDRQILECNLPSEVLKEFESLVNGLIPAFAMKAAATIRQNTGRIISKFGNDLDRAYLAHRALLPTVEDSEVFMLDNFVSYLRNILAINKVDKQTLDKVCITKWIDENDEVISKVLTHKKKDYTFTKEELKLLITEGFLSDIKPTLLNHLQNEKNVEEFLKHKTNILNLTRILNRPDNDTYVDDNSKNLSILTSFRRTFEDLIVGVELPYLTQGSVIYSVKDKVFLLCITPKCDTARVEGSRVFSFTKLTRLSKGKEFDLVIPVTDFIERDIDIDLRAEKKQILEKLGYDPHQKEQKNDEDKIAIKRLDQIEKYFYPGKVFAKSESSFFDLVHVEFNSDQTNRVMPEDISGSLEYSAKNSEMKYVWIGDLEDLDTQNRVSNLVGNLNRIGTNEVEWLRRQYQ